MPQTLNPIRQASLDVRGFVALLDAQVACYRQLSGLVERQSRLISAGDITRLMTVLAERQKVTQRVSELASAILPWRTKWPESRERCSTTDRHQAESLLKQIGDLAQAIVRQDETDAGLLRARKSSVAQSMQELQAGSRAAHAYAGSGESGSRRVYAE